MEKKKSKILMRAVACGGLVGLANSLFGGGGGMITVPLLKGLGLTEKEAHATAILVILPVSLLSFFIYLVRGYFVAEVAIPSALGVLVGGLLGAKLLQGLPTRWIAVVFAFLQALAGAWLAFGG
ncbi:MAG: sulfite exporter TauE/SafE family protein [Clostridia bacterium]|nr:sulfite exporter TauE/SafE family protein [Clostridia bacterium]